MVMSSEDDKMKMNRGRQVRSRGAAERSSVDEMLRCFNELRNTKYLDTIDDFELEMKR